MIRIVTLFMVIGFFASCSYHSGLNYDKLKSEKYLSENFIDGSKEVSIKTSDIRLPDWKFSVLGKRVLPRLNKEQRIIEKEYIRLAEIRKYRIKQENIEHELLARKEKLEEKINKINTRPSEKFQGRTSILLDFCGRRYLRIGYDYEYDERWLFWGMIKWDVSK